MSETAIRKMLKRMAKSSGEVWTAESQASFEGKTRLCTARTEYEFSDGVCTAVVKDGVRKVRGGFVGMRLVGWLGSDGEQVRVTPRWQRGASAVLWKPGLAGASVALTSSTVSFVTEVGSSGVRARTDQVPAARASESSIRRAADGSLPRLKINRPSTGSMTRIHAMPSAAPKGGPAPIAFPKAVPRPGK